MQVNELYWSSAYTIHANSKSNTFDNLIECIVIIITMMNTNFHSMQLKDSFMVNHITLISI